MCRGVRRWKKRVGEEEEASSSCSRNARHISLGEHVFENRDRGTAAMREEGRALYSVARSPLQWL